MALTLTTVTDDELRALEAPSVISERELAALEDAARELLTSQRPRRSSRILADTLADVEAPRPPRANRRSIFGRSRKSVAPSANAAEAARAARRSDRLRDGGGELGGDAEGVAGERLLQDFGETEEGVHL